MNSEIQFETFDSNNTLKLLYENFFLKNIAHKTIKNT